MIATIIPLICFAELFLVLGNLLTKLDWPRAFLRAAILWGIYAIISLELLSLFSWISKLSLCLLWFLPSMVLGIVLYLVHYHLKTIELPAFSLPNSWRDRIFIGAVGSVLLITFIVAWIAPPQTGDSHVYHMSRVAHWAQNHSIRPYVTGIRFQNTMSQAAELIILHFYIMAGSDRLVNLAQWFSMVGSLIGVYLLASQLGACQMGKFLTIAYVASLPMGIVQASSTMTDYVTTFWVVCTVSEGLNLIRGHTQWLNSIFLGSSAGLAIATKPTSFAFLLPFAILIPVQLLRQITPRRFLLTTLLILLCVFLLNIGHYARNNALYGSPMGHKGTIQRHANELINGKVIVSNIIRHASLHVGTPWEDVNDWIYHQIVKIHVKLDQDINDPKTTFTEFRILTPNTYETLATNPIHAYIIVIGLILTFTLRPRINLTTGFYVMAVAFGFIVFSAFFKYQIFGTRLHLPFFVLMAPYIGIIFSKTIIPGWIPHLGILLILISFPWLFQIPSRPVIPNPNLSSVGSIFLETRKTLYFPDDPARLTKYKTITDKIKVQNCSNVGLFLSGSSSEYLWWVLFGAPRESLQIEWIVSDSPTTRYEDPNFKACAVICENCPTEWTKIRGVPLMEGLDGGPFKLFLKEEE